MCSSFTSFPLLVRFCCCSNSIWIELNIIKMDEVEEEEENCKVNWKWERNERTCKLQISILRRRKTTETRHSSEKRRADITWPMVFVYYYYYLLNVIHLLTLFMMAMAMDGSFSLARSLSGSSFIYICRIQLNAVAHTKLLNVAPITHHFIFSSSSHHHQHQHQSTYHHYHHHQNSFFPFISKCPYWAPNAPGA